MFKDFCQILNKYRRIIDISGILLYSLLLLSCRFQEYPYELIEVNQKNVPDAHRIYFVDLSGYTEDELLVMRDYEGQFTETTVRDGDFNIFSQLNNSLYVNRISYYDVDNDGEMEFLITTRSFKNHREVINGTDDMHSYLIILNKSREVFFKEEMAGEFSKLNCFIGEDDSQEIITVKTT